MDPHFGLSVRGDEINTCPIWNVEPNLTVGKIMQYGLLIILLPLLLLQLGNWLKTTN